MNSMNDITNLQGHLARRSRTEKYWRVGLVFHQQRKDGQAGATNYHYLMAEMSWLLRLEEVAAQGSFVPEAWQRLKARKSGAEVDQTKWTCGGAWVHHHYWQPTADARCRWQLVLGPNLSGSMFHVTACVPSRGSTNDAKLEWQTGNRERKKPVTPKRSSWSKRRCTIYLFDALENAKTQEATAVNRILLHHLKGMPCPSFGQAAKICFMLLEWCARQRKDRVSTCGWRHLER